MNQSGPERAQQHADESEQVSDERVDLYGPAGQAEAIASADASDAIEMDRGDAGDAIDSAPSEGETDDPAVPRSFRLSDRTLWVLLGLAAAVLAVAIGFAVWLNTAPPLWPVPVASSPRA